MSLSDHHLDRLRREAKPVPMARTTRGLGTSVQWHGTQLCMDFRCACGERTHYDGWGGPRIECLMCGRRYEIAPMLCLRPMGTDDEADHGDTITVNQPRKFERIPGAWPDAIGNEEVVS